MDRYEGYLVSPEGIERLTASGIVDRIAKAKKKGELGCFDTFIDESDVANCAKEMREGGFYASLPEDDRKAYFQKMQKIFKDKNAVWRINRLGDLEEEGVVVDDFLLLLGDLASKVLKPKEFADYSKNGFNSFTDWIGCVGALVKSESKTGFMERGYIWETNFADGRKIVNLIGGNIHGDLLVEQNDVTGYPTIDPLGNPVSYRPVTQRDKKFMAPHHSTEPSLLVATLDFIDQTGIKSEVFEDKAQKVIHEIRGGGRVLGNFSEAFDGPEDAASSFIGYGLPFARITQDGSFTHTQGHFLFTQSEGVYVACITPRENLGFFYRQRSEEGKKELRVEFDASEIDKVIYGLVHQARSGLGRTNPGTLANILEYRFSDDFKRDVVDARG